MKGKTSSRIEKVNNSKSGVWFQPNKHITGDCSVRCVCAALDLSWKDSFNLLVDYATKNQYMPNDMITISSVIEKNGFVGVTCKAKRGVKKPTVNSFCKEHKKGRYVLRLSRHVVTVIDGKFYDIWDCGDCSVYKYWEKK